MEEMRMSKLIDGEVIWDEYDLYQQLKELYNNLELIKLHDRSEKDRAFAIVLTDLEKVIAYYDMYIL